MKSNFFAKKQIIILVVCLFVIATIALISILMISKRNDITKTTNDESVNITDNKTRYLHIYTVDPDHQYIIEKYAEENWDFDYNLNFYTSNLVLSTNDVVELIVDSLTNDSNPIDMYCVPSYAIEFIKGELAEYACTYKDLGINVKKALKKADIPKCVIDNGTNSAGEVVALPYMADVSIFVYRRSVAKEVWGTDNPDEINKIIGGGSGSWEKFKQAARTLKEHDYYIVPGFTDLAYSVDDNDTMSTSGDINPAWEEYMDVSKFLYDNGYIKDTESWTDQWLKDLDNDGNKIFAYITISDLYQYLYLDNSAGDWAVCMAPYNIVHNQNSGMLISKNSPNKDILGPFIEWLTLDPSENGYQYKAASGALNINSNIEGEKISVISGTVLKNVDSSREFLGGQNINPIIYKILKKPHFLSKGSNSNKFYYWKNAIKSYLYDGKSKELVMDEYKKFMSHNQPARLETEQDKAIVWKDKEFEKAIRIILKKPKSDIYLSDLYKITYLHLSDKNISNLEDIVNFKNLTSLYCESNDISNITWLKELSNLEVLYLNNNKIEDISSLGELVNLKELSIRANKIKDITALKELTNLKTLYIGGNNIKDISSLASLVNLEYLELSESNISDISRLKDLKKLNYLDLSDNKINDISALSQLEAIIELILDNNNISDIRALEALSTLEYLSLSNNIISEIGNLSDLINLKYLYLDDNRIKDIGGLSNMRNLVSLSLRNNQIIDISNLYGLTRLEHLDMTNNEVNDIKSISEFENLESLFMADNKITDISPISKMKNLRSLALPGNDIKDTSPANHVPHVSWNHEVDVKYYNLK